MRHPMFVSVFSNASVAAYRHSAKLSLMRHITTIIFDLDDTLWDLPQVIAHAENTMYAWFAQHYPAITQRFDREALRRLRNEIGKEFPAMGHDLMFLREQTYKRLALECG